MKDIKVGYEKVSRPPNTIATEPVYLTDDTMRERKNRILMLMKQHDFDSIVIYADREHGANYGYLTGFEPRFEESLLVIHDSGKAYLMLGNESLKMALYSRIEVEAIHTPHFSLPNQPMETESTWLELLKKVKIDECRKIGIVGWKLFTGKLEDNKRLFDVPYYVVDGIKKVSTDATIENATGLFIDPVYGCRTRMNANEIAHYEYAAATASHCVYEVMNAIEVGKTEMELAELLAAQGQPLSVQTICATGERFTNATVEPRNKKVQLGDRITFTMGLKGGLSHRCGYAVSEKSQLKVNEKDYLERVAFPYYKALATWYSNIGIGVKGADFYTLIDEILPQKKYKWTLNPGHYTADEEWLSSPFYPNSEAYIQSGMMLQMDIIISVSGFGGTNAEDGIAVADENLRDDIRKQYPELWQRFMKRRMYMQEVLNIPLKEEILPMSTICGYYRPYMLNKDNALYIK